MCFGETVDDGEQGRRRVVTISGELSAHGGNDVSLHRFEVDPKSFGVLAGFRAARNKLPFVVAHVRASPEPIERSLNAPIVSDFRTRLARWIFGRRFP